MLKLVIRPVGSLFSDEVADVMEFLADSGDNTLGTRASLGLIAPKWKLALLNEAFY